jgi:hypothetical protein
VDHEIKDVTPWTNNNGIVKFIEFPVRIPTMSHRAFHLYWQRHHSPNVMNVTGFSQFMRKYNTGHVYPQKVHGLPAHYQQTTPFEGAAEVWVNGLSEVSAWLGHPLYAELIQPDEPRFIQQDGSVEVIISKEERLYEPHPDLHEANLTKLYILYKRRAELEHDAFHAELSAVGKLLLAQSSLRHLIQKLVISHKLRAPLPEGLALADIDAVGELWFNNRQDITRLFEDPAYVELVQPREQTVTAKNGIRALVAKMHVVHDEFSFQPSTMQPLAFTWN